MKNLSGQRFGRWTVVGYSHKAREPYGGLAHFWMCKCDCGSERPVRQNNLLSGKSQSCPCVKIDKIRARSTIHGKAMRGKTHPVYRSWQSIMKRCYDPKQRGFKYWGGRGITVCERWKTSTGFIDDMLPIWKPGTSIDRIDNNGNYEPGNVRWANKQEQNSNTRRNRRIEFNGETKTIKQWSETIGGSASLVSDRLKWGWTIEEALTTPPRAICR
jgi:hypothetical protein